MLTQLEIAEKLGVSRTAVAYALSDNPHAQKQIAPETRLRIVETARELGYRPHRHAQLMRGVKSGVIGTIKSTTLVQTMVERTFFASQAIQAAGYGQLVTELVWDDTGVRRAVETMLDARVEGVLLAGIGGVSKSFLDGLQQLRAAQIPVVAVGSAHLSGVYSVTTDYRQGMAELTKHLLALGHRTLALVLQIHPEVTHTPLPWGLAERLAGFREAAAAAGLSPAQARVLYQPATSDWTDGYAPGQSLMQSLLKSGDRPSAVLCSNDNYAIGALAACADAGLKVPDDIAITGFDDTSAGRYTRPALTTVAQPTEAAARKAVELLVKQIRGEAISTSDQLVKLPCQLVVRQSCGSNQKQGRES